VLGVVVTLIPLLICNILGDAHGQIGWRHD
jgi:uncharacterized transporter YbjL